MFVLAARSVNVRGFFILVRAIRFQANMNPNHFGFMFVSVIMVTVGVEVMAMVVSAIGTMDMSNFLSTMVVIVFTVWSVLVFSHVSPQRLASPSPDYSFLVTVSMTS